MHAIRRGPAEFVRSLRAPAPYDDFVHLTALLIALDQDS